MTNYENLKAAAQSLGDFCDNHSPEVDKCDCREQREKRGQEMKRVFAILLTLSIGSLVPPAVTIIFIDLSVIILCS